MFDSALILIADADERLRAFLAGQLDADAATVRVAADTAQSRARADTHAPHALLLGTLERPGAAIGLLRSIRSASGQRGEPAASLPIIALVDGDDELATLRAFDAGADDVVARAGAYTVLRARLRVLLGLSGHRCASPIWRVGGLEVDPVGHAAHLYGEPLELSATEFALLALLVSDPYRVFTREDLMRMVWGSPGGERTRTLDSHVCRLRRKLRVHRAGLLVTVRGVGFRLLDAAPYQLTQVA